MGLDMHSRKELIKADYKAYQEASKKGRGEILDKLVSVTNLNRSCLSTALGTYREEPAAGGRGKRKSRPLGNRGGRPKVYGGDFVKVLRAVWSGFGCSCGKLLIAAIHEMTAFPAASQPPPYGITDEIKELLLKISCSEADLLLRPARKAPAIKGISTTRAASVSLRSQAPVQTYFDREALKPGSSALDAAAHCGTPASGQFCKTLTGTGVFSGWIEERSLLNSGEPLDAGSRIKHTQRAQKRSF